MQFISKEIDRTKGSHVRRITRDSTDMTKYVGTCIEMAEPAVRHFVVNAAIRTAIWVGGDETFVASPYSFYFSSFNGSSQIQALYNFSFKSKLRATML